MLTSAPALSNRIHTFRDFGAFSPKTAGEQYKAFEKSILDAVAVSEVLPLPSSPLSSTKQYLRSPPSANPLSFPSCTIRVSVPPTLAKNISCRCTSQLERRMRDREMRESCLGRTERRRLRLECRDGELSIEAALLEVEEEEER